MRTIPFEPEHLLQIDDVVQVLSEIEKSNLQAKGEHAKAAGITTTIVDDNGNILACGGIGIMWPGSGEAWCVIAEKTAHSASLMKFLRSVFDGWIKDNNLLRVHAMTKEGWQSGESFLRFLGMKKECVLQKMGPDGINQVLYARIM